jgi:hypothetical protein
MTLLYIWLGLELAIVLGAIIYNKPTPTGSTDWDRSHLPLLDQIRYRNTTKEDYLKQTNQTENNMPC